LYIVKVSFISDGIQDADSHQFDCTREDLINEVYRWCKNIEENSESGQIVIGELIVNDKEDIKEAVLILEKQQFFNIDENQ
jgi:predicted DNA binding protein